MALDLPLPKKIYAHGWLLMGGEKLSKSKEREVKDVQDPRILASRYGIDSVRLFLQKEIVFGQDGNYSQELFLTTINNALANQYGNLVSRTLGMIEKYLGGVISPAKTSEKIVDDFKQNALTIRSKVFENMQKLNVSGAINNIFDICDMANKSIDDCAPLVLFKEGNLYSYNC